MSKGTHVPLRIKNWDYSQPALYMVTIYVDDRSHRFGKMTLDSEVELSDAGKMVLQELRALPRRFNHVSLDELVIMPNHVHFLIGINVGDQIGTENLGRVIGAFKSRTTNRYITGIKMGLLPPFHRRLWQIDYFETIMRDEKMADARRRYIINNPANWREDPEMQTPEVGINTRKGAQR